MTRILIAGGPRTGKSFTAEAWAKHLGLSVRCTDSIIHLGWTKASLDVATWIHDPRPGIIEGTVVVRAIRRWLLQTGMSERPADIVFYAANPVVAVTKDQLRMIAGCNTIWSEIVGELHARGCKVQALALPTS